MSVPIVLLTTFPYFLILYTLETRLPWVEVPTVIPGSLFVAVDVFVISQLFRTLHKGFFPLRLPSVLRRK